MQTLPQDWFNADYSICLQFYIYLFVIIIYFQYTYYCYTYLIDQNFKSSIFQSLKQASHASFLYSEGSYYLHWFWNWRRLV